MRRILIVSVIAIVFAALGIYYGVEHEAAPTQHVSATDALFNQSLPDLQGKQQTLSQWKGKILIVNFWATWCGPCVKEMPALSALALQIKDQNVQILGIGVDSAANILEFSSKYSIKYPLYVAGMNGTELLQMFDNPAGGLPFTLLIGADGRLKKNYLGALDFQQLQRDLAALTPAKT